MRTAVKLTATPCHSMLRLLKFKKQFDKQKKHQQTLCKKAAHLTQDIETWSLEVYAG